MWLAHTPGGCFVTMTSVLVFPSPKNKDSRACGGLSVNLLFNICRQGQKGFPVYAPLRVCLQNVPVAFVCCVGW